MLNNVNIMGRLTANPEIRFTTNGTKVCNFSIAVQRPKKKDSTESEADFFSCVAWRGAAEIIEKYFVKGNLIAIQGHLRSNVYLKNNEKRYMTQIVVDEVSFTGERKQTEIRELPDYDENDYTVSDEDAGKIPMLTDEEIEQTLTDEGVPF